MAQRALSIPHDLSRLAARGRRRLDRIRLARRTREEYKATWTTLERLVGIRPDDVVLEIGCGIGRVGEELAGRCRQWIGCDVSPTMLVHARKRLAERANVRLVEVS